MPMPRQNSPTTAHDDGWLITPRALTSVATVVGLVYTLHAPARYILRVEATVEALNARITTLEAEIDRQRGMIIAAERARFDPGETAWNGGPDALAEPSGAFSTSHSTTTP
jgi:hypothetical protein